VSGKKWEHRGTATVRLAGKDIEKIFRENGSAWILNWMSGLQKSAKLSEIKSEPSDVDGGPPTLVLVFTVPHDAEEANADIRFIGSTWREQVRTIAAAAVDHVASWLQDDALDEVEEQEEEDILIMGDDPIVSELQKVLDTMTKRQHRAIDKSFASAAALLETGQTRNTLIDLAAEDICGSFDE
jgi:hypothetical protein